MPPFRILVRIIRSIGMVLLLTAAAFGGAGIGGCAECAPRRVEAHQIPRAAHQTLAYIRAHQEAPPGYVGGRRFGNFGRGGEQKLPLRDAQGRNIEYREWDIYPKIQGRNRGPERLVTGSDGRAWYTADHYCSYTELR